MRGRCNLWPDRIQHPVADDLTLLSVQSPHIQDVENEAIVAAPDSGEEAGKDCFAARGIGQVVVQGLGIELATFDVEAILDALRRTAQKCKKWGRQAVFLQVVGHETQCLEDMDRNRNS